ncbi:MAG: metal-dependent transcriptional regulator [Gemmatimonadaceae bacterium]|nr:metal-dependent transcriptional regulator [Gemmatimonadaceae bacterium]
MSRSPAGLTVEAEDYLKAIYELSHGIVGAPRRSADGSAAGTRDAAGADGAGSPGGVDVPVGTTALAARLGVAAASVSGMLRRLSKAGLVRAARYRGARLTPRGRAIALQLIRRHRVIETFLVTRLGYAWEEVHDEAERLEHAASAGLVDRMARDLGDPASDPHGAPIPTAAGEVDERRFATLASLEPGASAQVQGMSGRDPALLRYLAGRGVRPGARVTVESREPFEGPIALLVGRKRVTMSPAAAANVWVTGAPASPASARPSRQLRRAPQPQRRSSEARRNA